MSSECYDYSKYLTSPYTPLTIKISIRKIGIKIPSLLQTHPFTISYQSPLDPYIPNMEAQPLNRMDVIIAARYAPLLLPRPLNAFPDGDYQKYVPRFNGHGEVTSEEHWNAYFSCADNQNIEHQYVWMRIFVQSLDGEVRKWFRELPSNSIDEIYSLE